MNKIINPSYINELRENISRKTGLIQVLLGPRQVGKTTSTLKMIEDHFQDRSHYVSADKIFHSDAAWLREQWQVASRESKILFVDEIQKCENWAETVKALYDQDKRQRREVRVVLLGSSSLELQKGLTESLTGRFQQVLAFHWNFAESKEAYGISFGDYLKYGGYPGSYPMIDQEKIWIDYVKNSIVGTVVEKDILQFHHVKSPALFRQAFEILVGYPAQEISLTKLLGQLQERGNVEIVKHYLRLYDGAFLIKGLEKYSEKLLKKKTSSPKILPLAPCFYFLSLQSDYEADELGRVFELVVGTQLVRTGLPLYYWREGGHEVDYVLTKGKRLWAIEVKSGRRKSRTGLSAFAKKFPRARTVVIDQGCYMEFEEDPIRFLERPN